MPFKIKIAVLREIFEDAYQGEKNSLFENNAYQNDEIQIFVGKQYTGMTSNESTEVDISIELPGKIIFIEAKLYSSVSMASPPEKTHDQIARKLRIGLDSPLQDNREFFFIFLDIAPYEKLNKREKKSEVLSSTGNGFHDKWRSAWLFKYYKFGRNNSLSPLKKVLKGIDIPSVELVASNMGWLTWSDLFKSILKGAIKS
jgi:hypothetical protein